LRKAKENNPDLVIEDEEPEVEEDDEEAKAQALAAEK